MKVPPFFFSQDDRLCRNHIRIYQRPSASSGDGSSSLFVCGTQSGIQPQCRMLNVSVVVTQRTFIAYLKGCMYILATIA